MLESFWGWRWGRKKSGSKVRKCSGTFRLMVEPLEDRLAPANIVVNTIADAGLGSLRAAIILSNASLDASDRITFAIPANQGTIITPLTPLPTILQPQTTAHPVTITGLKGVINRA